MVSDYQRAGRKFQPIVCEVNLVIEAVRFVFRGADLLLWKGEVRYDNR